MDEGGLEKQNMRLWLKIDFLCSLLSPIRKGERLDPIDFVMQYRRPRKYDFSLIAVCRLWAYIIVNVLFDRLV